MEKTLADLREKEALEKESPSYSFGDRCVIKEIPVTDDIDKLGTKGLSVTLIAMKRVMSTVTTTDSNSIQKKRKESIHLSYFEGKIQAQLLSHAAVGLIPTQDSHYEVLKTDTTTDEELKLNPSRSDDNLPGITELKLHNTSAT